MASWQKYLTCPVVEPGLYGNLFSSVTYFVLSVVCSLVKYRYYTLCGPSIVMVAVVRPSVCHTWVCPELSEIDVWLLGNLNRKPGFPIQNRPSDSQSEIRSTILDVSGLALYPFRPKWVVGLVTVVNWSVGMVTSQHTTLGTVVGQLSSHPITDNILLISS